MLLLNTGVTLSEPSSSTPGYVLFAPIGGDKVYLTSTEGTVTHHWNTGQGFTYWCYLRENGNLFVNERSDDRQGVALIGSGLMREYDWEGNLVWEHFDPFQHHDARRLPHGGAVYLAYADLDETEQRAVLGGVPGSEFDGTIHGEAIREIDENGHVIWEWNLKQLDLDQFPLHRNANRWSHGHTNTVQPLPNEQFLISCKALNLVFVVDKKLNKMVWHFQDDQLGGQHDAQQLDNGNILIFANGCYASDLHHSQVWEVDPSTNEIVWRYVAKDNPQSFFSPHIGGCQRLASGNTLICEGGKGCLFETTPEGDVVWEYVSPHFVEDPSFGKINWLFRARHYAKDAPELQGRL